jgi:hypothetical protein
MSAAHAAGAVVLALAVSASAAASGHGLQRLPAFAAPGAGVRTATKNCMRTHSARTLRSLLPTIASRSLQAWGNDHSLERRGRLRARVGLGATGGAAASVASAEAEGGAKVWVETVEKGEHGFKKVIMEVDVGGQMLRLEAGEIGRLAAGAVVAKQADSVVYSTACGDLDLSKEEVIEDFVPLTVHYQVFWGLCGYAPRVSAQS